MARYYLEITCQVRGISGHDIFDDLADAVHDLADVIDPDLGASLDEGTFDFCMSVDAANGGEALLAGLSAVRAAIHAAGGSTPGWERHFAEIRHVVHSAEALAAC